MKYIYLCCFFIATFFTFAQTDIDGIMMEKNNLCVGAVYQYSSFNKYWEGTLLRENLNIGTVSNKSVTIMGNYGLTNKLNILFSLPYIKTAASAGTLMGQKGFQDFSISAKYMPLDKEINKFLVSGYILGGYSNPVSNYNPDFLPLSIGLQSNTGWLRLMTDIQRGKIYSTFSAAYIRKSNIKIDRDAYFTTEYHYTNEVFMPDAITYNFRFGYRSKYFISDVFYDNWITQKGGFDITRNNMPFPSNTMNLSKIGAYIKYIFKKIDGLSLIASYSEVVTGRNVGKYITFNGGVFYVVNFNKNKKSIENEKNKLLKYILILSISIFFSCNKDLDENNEQFPQLNPTNQDESAGNWIPILLTSNEEFTIDTPFEINSSSYLSELNEIKSFQKNITQAEREIIKYWSAGSVLRWNEIMRTLVAKHNIPPYQNEDGTYTTPSSANPFANPEFPFSSPPYAARAYAYVSAAQYDALVAAWHYKFVYNRQSPYLVDNTIKVLVPQNTLPSYPSEDAVIGGATVEMLKLLFPTEIAYINKKLEEQKLYRIISGANVRSDIDAGISLGKKVAGKFIVRAKTDGTGLAVGTPEIWAQMQFQTEATGEIPWLSQEHPPRPPMLPLFKNVKSFFLSPEMIVNNRPIPPPSTSSVEFTNELAEVKNYVENANRNQVKIVNFWADGVGTFTPPGHWNSIASKEFVKKNYSEVRWARNMALLNICMMDAAISCWDAKFTYFNPRPSQIDPSIKTLTGLPNFPAYVSGHSTFSGAAATFLSHILPDKSSDFSAMANEASVSRMYGGIHYRSDCEQGLILGYKVGEVTIQRALLDGAE